MKYRVATEVDLKFMKETYDENIASLHGVQRDISVWKELLSDEKSVYYIVYEHDSVAWFRLDYEEEELWLGMLQVKPAYQRQGIGKFILLVIEELATKEGFQKIGIHTTEDNLAGRAIYLSAGYDVTEIGPCTTADGKERVGYTFEKEI